MTIPVQKRQNWQMFGFKLVRAGEHPTANARISELEDRLETAERQLKHLDADFTDLWDRVQKQVARLVKREQRQEAAGETNDPTPLVPSRPLTPAQQAALEVGRRMGVIR